MVLRLHYRPLDSSKECVTNVDTENLTKIKFSDLVRIPSFLMTMGLIFFFFLSACVDVAKSAVWKEASEVTFNGIHFQEWKACIYSTDCSEIGNVLLKGCGMYRMICFFNGSHSL